MLNQLKSEKALMVYNAITLAAMLIAIGLVFFYAPMEAVMGQVQRIFYFHVPSAWVSFVAFVVTAVAGIMYLRAQNLFWDQVAYSSVEIGLVFTLMTICSGSIWAYPAWNTWWTWDPRLTTYTIMALIYVAYLMLRQALEDPGRRARIAAVYAIFGVLSVPITFMSIRWWRTIHPVVIGNGSESAQGGFAMTDPMRTTFIVANLAFLLLYACFLINRVRLARATEQVEQFKAKVMSA
jgi:heme exporter protein C